MFSLLQIGRVRPIRGHRLCGEEVGRGKTVVRAAETAVCRHTARPTPQSTQDCQPVARARLCDGKKTLLIHVRPSNMTLPSR